MSELLPAGGAEPRTPGNLPGRQGKPTYAAVNTDVRGSLSSSPGTEK